MNPLPTEALTGFVYFIETLDGRYIKIGYSRTPERRTRALGTAMPGDFKTKTIGWMNGTTVSERELHERFKAHRDNGEWFRAVLELRQHIESLNLIAPGPKRPRGHTTKEYENPIKPPEPVDQAMCTRVEAAEYLRISPRTLDGWIRLGRVRVVLPGGPGTYPRITRAELERLAAGK